PEDKDENLLQKAKEGVVDAVGTVFKNPRKKQLATKVPIEGDFSDPSANTLEAIWEVLKNAYIEALMPSVDNEINIESATTVEEDKPNLLQRIFGSGKKEEPEPPAEKKKPEGLYRNNTSTSRQN